MSEEQSSNGTAKAAIETIASGEGQLAGDPVALKEPDNDAAAVPADQDALVSAGGDIGTLDLGNKRWDVLLCPSSIVS